MLSGDEVLSTVSTFLEGECTGWNPETMRIDWEGIHIENGHAVVSYESRAVLDEGRRDQFLLGNLPVLVDLSTGACRFMTLDEVLHGPDI
ncbi:hypothetical protein LRE75_25230 [Streptomyces sp. 372A]